MSWRLVTAVVALWAVGDPVRAHVALTFPPARQYPLDFLDNVRTRAPCGMPRGDVVTSFPMGAVLNVTWSMGYAHEGGFRLELLNRSEEVLFDLTPTARPRPPFVAGDAITTQHALVALPAGLACRGCTIRLVRQALDWGPHYLFWSCADIDVVPVQEFTKICSGRGIIDEQGACNCHRPYTGSVCQYQEECWEDSDCSGNGKCISTGSTSPPDRQCYCQMGWHGEHCELESSVKSPVIDLNQYSRQDLAPDYHLFWRILHDTAELEVLLHSKGTSYVALGWRPHGISISCKTFPHIHDRRASPRLLDSDGVTHADELLAEETATAYILDDETPSFTQSSGIIMAREVEDGTTTSESLPMDALTRPKRQVTVVRAPDLAFRGNTSSPDPKAISNSGQLLTTKPEEGREAKRTRLVIHKYPPMTSYTPKMDFHPMDCCDMVIGSSKGNLSRVRDYYTRDRSTPRQDSDFGGRNDLTAAMGFEINGKTTVLFRRKLKAAELTDHPILSGPMEVIWARGQENSEFYKKDELKYHGGERGKLLLNFFEERKPTTPKPVVPEEKGCAGQWGFPLGCKVPDCEYHVAWRHRPATDEILFIITSIHVDHWTGIGFSKDASMPQSDAVIGWVDHAGRTVVLDTWLGGYSPPQLDRSQDIYNISGARRDGKTVLSFARRRVTSDVQMDADLSDCPYFLFPVRGGSFNAVSKKIGKHSRTPMVSSQRICVHICSSDSNDVATVGSTASESTASTATSQEMTSQTTTTTTAPPTTLPTTPSTPSTTAATTTTTAGAEISPCSGEWRYPADCQPPSCQYRATWNYRDETDDILFTISSNNFRKWTGIGFSASPTMPTTDAVIGWVLDTGRFFMMDTWLEGYSPPLLDPSQDLHNETGRLENGITTLQFARRRQSADLEHDLSFSEQCLYLLFPVTGGVYNAVNKKIRKHEATPHISPQPVCIRSCAAATEATSRPSTLPPATTSLPTPGPTVASTVMPATSPEPSHIYLVDLRLVGRGEVAGLDLPTVLARSVDNILKDIDGYEGATLHDTQTSVVRLEVAVRGNPQRAQASLDEVLRGAVRQGRFGPVEVDPAFLRVSSAETEELNSLMPVQPKDPPSSGGGGFLEAAGITEEQLKMYLVIGGVGLLLLLVAIQGIWMTCSRKDSSTSSLAPAGKSLEKGGPVASSWRDLTSYEPHHEGAPNTESPPLEPLRGPRTYSATFERPGRPAEPTQQRPHSVYATQDRSGRKQAPMDVRPDFYFMPHQRKYSGEVVSVFVDYPNHKYSP